MLRRFADLIIDSDVAFPELLPAEGVPDVTIRLGALSEDGSTPLQTWRVDDDDWLTIARGPGGYHLRFEGLECRVSTDGSRIDAAVSPELAGPALVHLLLHQVLPLAVSRRGRTVLHACAVETPRGTIGFLGGSGAGKSTLAAAFTARGAALVADDALVVDTAAATVTAWPTADGLRLWDDVADLLPSIMSSAGGAPGEKKRVPARLSAAPTPLVRLILIGDARVERVSLTPVPRADARMALLSHLFRLDIGDAAESRRLFDDVHRLVSLVPSRCLSFPDGTAPLEEAAGAVLRDLEAS